MDSQAESEQDHSLEILQTINTTLDNLVSSGIYNFQSDQEVRRINLAVTSSVTEALVRTDLPIKDVLVLLNKAVTLGQQKPSEGLRTKPVFLMGYYPPTPDEIPEVIDNYSNKLQDLVQNPENRIGDNPEKVATWAYFLLTSIHPFQDGNGRTARALVEYILLKMGMENPILPAVREDLSRGDDSLMLDATLQAGLAMTYEQSLKTTKREVAGDIINQYISNSPKDINGLFAIHSELPRVKNDLFDGRDRKTQKQWITSINVNQNAITAVNKMRASLKVS